MRLDILSIIDFKNIADQRLELSPGINCFVGDNGAGKTNILDAVHYLAMARSMNTTTDSQCVMQPTFRHLVERSLYKVLICNGLTLRLSD